MTASPCVSWVGLGTRGALSIANDERTARTRAVVAGLHATQKAHFAIKEIITEGRKLFIADADGKRKPLKPTGYEHFKKS